MSHLFICYTPFQLWLVKQIIEQEKIQSYSLVTCFRKTVSTEKYRYYFDQLAQQAQQALWIPVPTYTKIDEVWLKSSLAPLEGKTYTDVYFANPEIFITWYVLQIIHFNRLHSFDDGARNFLPDPPEKNHLSSHIKRFITRFKLQYTIFNIKQHLTDHFTIDPTLPNLYQPLIPIRLPQLPFPTKRCALFHQAPHYKIWIGSTDEVFLSRTQFNKIEQHLCQKLNISHYLPHPRLSKPVVPEGTQLISTPMIFEDWLQHMMQTHPDAKFKIYSLFSTTCLSLPAHHPNLQCYVVQTPFFDDLYPIFKQKGVKIIRDKTLWKTVWSAYQRPPRYVRIYRNVVRAIKKVSGRLPPPTTSKPTRR